MKNPMHQRPSGLTPRLAAAMPGAYRSARRSVTPPAGLCVESRKFWTQLQGAYGISDEGGLALLSLAATAYKRLLEAQRLIDAEGIVVKDRFGHAKPHPACTLERDSRISVLAALRELGLDLEPVKRLAR